MAAVLYQDQYSSFINAVARKRREIGVWTSVIVQVASNQNTASINLDDVVQVLEFEFNGNDILILIHRVKRRVFLIVRKDAKAALAAIEKIIQKTFANEEIKIEAGVPLEKGLQHLCEQLGGCIPPDDHPAIINLKRLARTSNSFFLVSKDVVKRERLSHTLKAYGKIMFLSDENEFIANYAASAPNAVFVDPLSLQDHHHKLLGHLKKDHDPYAHIIGVGQSPQAHDLIKYKTMGLDGYIIWPGEHDALMKYISRIPTLTSPAQTSISLRSTGK